jgi:ATP-dependent RNA helicase RhlE
MLDMGFLPDVRRILQTLPAKRQTLFFSATMSGEPQALADRILKDPARAEVAPQATTVESVAQSVVFVDKVAKQDLLARLLGDPSMSRTLVFTRTKHGANKVVAKLLQAGIRAEAIHANKSQSQRERALAGFKAGRTAVLVATDIAARGLDVDDISHVVNFDLPNIPESYVHRIGRTARAGAEGSAISFCDPTERSFLRDIERQIRMHIPVLERGAMPARGPRREPLGPPSPDLGVPPQHRSPQHRPDGSSMGHDTRTAGRADAGPHRRPAERGPHPRASHPSEPRGSWGPNRPQRGGQHAPPRGDGAQRPAAQRPRGHWGGAPSQGPSVPYGRPRRRRSGSGPSRQN